MLTIQPDFLYLVYGLVFVLLAALLLALRERTPQWRTYRYLAAFGLVHGVYEWVLLFQAVEPSAPPVVARVALALLLGSFMALVAFARRIGADGTFPGSRPHILLVQVVMLGMVIGLATAAGWTMEAAVRLVFGLGGGLLAGWALWREGDMPDMRMVPFRLAGVALAGYGVATGVFVSASGGGGWPPWSAAGWVVPIEVVRMAGVLGLCLALWYALRERSMPVRLEGVWFDLPVRIWQVVALIALVLGGGLVATNFAGRLSYTHLHATLLSRVQSAAIAVDPSAHPSVIDQLLTRWVRVNPDVAAVMLVDRLPAPVVRSVVKAPESGSSLDDLASGVVLPLLSDAGPDALVRIRGFGGREAEGGHAGWYLAAVPFRAGLVPSGPPLLLVFVVPAAEITVQVARVRALVLVITLLIVMIFLDFFIRQYRVWELAHRLGASESRYRALNTALDERVSERTDALFRVNEALRREVALHAEAETRYRTLTEQVPAVTYIVDLVPAPRTTFISHHVQAMFGYTAEEWLADPLLWKQVLHEEDREAVLQQIQECNRTAEPFYLVYRAWHRDGQVVWVRNHAAYLQGDEGHPRQTHGMMFNVTTEVEAEQALRASRERYQTLYRAMRSAFILYRPLRDAAGAITDFRYEEVNPAFEREVGLKAEAVLGSTLKTVFPNLEPVWWEALVRAADGGGAVSLQHYAVDVDRYFDVNINPLDDGTVALLAFDITERERMEQEKVRSQRLESLGLLAGGIAHDFNNILTAILGNLSLLRLTLAGAGEESGRLVADAEKAALRARDLTRQLLTFSRGGAPVKKRVDLRTLVRDVAEFVLHGSPVRLELALPDQPLAAELDPGQIGQVIQNLVINADQAMPGGGTLRIRGERMILEPQDSPAVLAPGPYIRLTVADEGTGIAPEVRDRIFDPYFTTKEHGTGLGLTTSYSIVRRHGGHLDVHSLVGQGATFTVLLPAAEQVDEPERAAPVASRAGHGRVLVMDDEVMILTLTRAILGHMGYQVAVAEDGEAAVQAYEEALAGGARFDAVILDLTIPGGLGGLETITRLRAIDPTVCAIVSSGYSEDPVMAHYAEYGFAGVAMKPYTAEYLADVLARLLSRERPAGDRKGGAA